MSSNGLLPVAVLKLHIDEHLSARLLLATFSVEFLTTMDLGISAEDIRGVIIGGLIIFMLGGLAVASVRVASRRFSGRRGRFDGLFSGLARGNAMYWHLNANAPHPDDMNAVPGPPGMSPRRRCRR